MLTCMHRTHAPMRMMTSPRAQAFGMNAASWKIMNDPASDESRTQETLPAENLLAAVSCCFRFLLTCALLLMTSLYVKAYTDYFLRSGDGYEFSQTNCQQVSHESAHRSILQQPITHMHTCTCTRTHTHTATQVTLLLPSILLAVAGAARMLMC